MDIKTLMNESPKVITVINAIKKDPDLLNELKTNPQEALNKIGVELNEEELGIVQKIEEFSYLQEKATGIFNLIKGWFGNKDKKIN